MKGQIQLLKEQNEDLMNALRENGKLEKLAEREKLTIQLLKVKSCLKELENKFVSRAM